MGVGSISKLSGKRFQSDVVYQIYVRSFLDTDGDGYGDIQGIIEKLPYIASLGVGYIWLNPIFPSPQYDNGYDVSDYCAIDPMFGTMEDFKLLIKHAEELGIGIILDMVFNHTSTEHIWFQKAMELDPYYKDFYYFQPEKEDGSPPTNWMSKFGGSAWEKVPDLGEYYLHLFHVKQADLNWKNPNVRQELFKILQFWLDMGVQGFRFDVINLVSKPKIFEDDFFGDGRRFYTDGPKMDQYLKEIYQVLGDGSNEDLLTVGELSSTSPDKCFRYSGADEKELSMIFSFHHLKVDYPSSTQKWALSDVDFHALLDVLHTWQVGMNKHNAWSALFWNNHDQPRALTRFASKKKEYHYQSATMLAATIHFMRGTPYIYQGEEIGMINPEFDDISDYCDVETLNYYRILKENGMGEKEVMEIVKARSRDNSRTPMQWTSGLGAGFSKGDSWIKVADNKAYINVQAEEEKGSGVLAFYRRLVSLRKKYDIIQTGNYTPFLESVENVVAYLRENEVQYLLCINNFSEQMISIPRHLLAPYAALKAEVLISNYCFSDVRLDRQLVIQPYETVAILLHKE